MVPKPLNMLRKGFLRPGYSQRGEARRAEREQAPKGLASRDDHPKGHGSATHSGNATTRRGIKLGHDM